MRLWGSFTPLNGGGERKILLVDASTILFLSLVLRGECFKHFFSFFLLEVESKAYSHRLTYRKYLLSCGSGASEIVFLSLMLLRLFKHWCVVLELLSRYYSVRSTMHHEQKGQYFHD
ncbi:hypothetical protein J2S37_000994 [Corynebacterium felinum]|uniref:Uncharacterized protein n=1 Tax=Corynebacterium felinum TaxID=131318 RepID=A0ABU2B7U1_9CORY|nr:hypothetical protein [Corynebacterium felinum]